MPPFFRFSLILSRKSLISFTAFSKAAWASFTSSFFFSSSSASLICVVKSVPFDLSSSARLNSACGSFFPWRKDSYLAMASSKSFFFSSGLSSFSARVLSTSIRPSSPLFLISWVSPLSLSLRKTFSARSYHRRFNRPLPNS